MAKRRFSGGSPLEWVAVRVSRSAEAQAAAREAIDLNLDDDEVAEIWQIDSDIQFATGNPSADQQADAEMALVMDPSYQTSIIPTSEALYEDLECFFTHFSQMDNELTTSGKTVIDENINKHVDFAKPILLATNPAMITVSDAACALLYFCRLYFTRKKAGRDDLTRILLKRR